MIKRLLALCLLLFLFIGLEAQPFSNGWINYSQDYYKIKIAQSGIYRLDSATLSSALATNGIQLSNIDPHRFQIFNKGVQQYIYIQGENDGQFNGSDFIEFYAEKNDGSLDSLLYVNTSFLPNPYYSLVNDTAVYFLTWNNSNSNRRMQVPPADTAFNSTHVSSYFYRDEIQENYAGIGYYEGATDAAGGTDVHYTSSEGWFDGNVIPDGGANSYYFSTPQIYTAGPTSSFKTVVVGASQMLANDHHIRIDFQGAIPQNIVDSNFTGYASKRYVYNLPSNAIGASNSFTYSSISVPSVTSSRTVVSYIELKYPHKLNLEGNTNYLMYLPDNSTSGQTKSYLNIINFSTSGTAHIYDLTNARRIDFIQNVSNYQVLVPNSGSDKKCFLFSDGNINHVTSLIPVTPVAKFTDFSTQIVDSAFIIITHKSVMSGSLQYKAYRSSFIGGSNNVVLADIDELYDQFAYGIVKSPLSIRGFCDFYIHRCIANHRFVPNNLFLIGKSMHLKNCRTPAWFDDGNDYPTNYITDIVPSYGNPSSDNLLTAGLNGTVLAPAIPTGRLSARKPQDVIDYLNKVKLFDTTSSGDWKKHVLHFGGGETTNEQKQFKGYLRNYAYIIKDTLFGGKVDSFFKTSSAPIQINTSDTLRDFINNGVSLMTFFGHASGQGFDQSTDDISSYNPVAGHYPFLLANSCLVGDMHEWELSSSETYVMIANKGMIGFLGSSGLGIVIPLNSYSTEIYHELSVKNYEKSIGSTIKKTISFLQPNILATNDYYTENTCLEMTLQGDPAVKVGPGTKPDFKITSNDVSFKADSIPDSIIVFVKRTNLGAATNKKSVTYLLRVFPNGDTLSAPLLFNKEPNYMDVVTFHLPIDHNNSKGVGLNKFYVTLDKNNQISELNENNNSSGEVDFIITGGDILPVYPYTFSIIQTDTITLKANTTDLFARPKNYVFQIDTIDTYNSHLMVSATINAPGGVVKWKPQNLFPHFRDSTVYYWRVSPDSTSPTNGYKWQESSFQYIALSHRATPGWEQAHFFQFKNDNYQYVKWNRPTRNYSFFNNIYTLFCTTGDNDIVSINDITYKLNNYVKSVYTCIYDPHSGFTFTTFDPVSGASTLCYKISGTDGTLGSYYCDPNTQHQEQFEYYDDTASSYLWQNRIANYLNSIPNGTYVLGYNEFTAASHMKYRLYEPALNNAFKSIGANNMLTIPDSLPYIIWGKKGANPGTATEVLGTSTTGLATLNTSFQTNWNVGFIASPIIGPAHSWHALHWRWKSLDPSATADSIVIRVIGINSQGVETVLANFKTDSTDVLDLSHYVNAGTYPNIRLVAYMADNTYHTAPQLKRWHVIYDPVPEAAVNPALIANNNIYISRDTIQEGDNFKVRLPIQNIGNIPFTQDSLLVTYWVTDASGTTHNLPPKLKKKPFNPNEVIMDTISVNSFGYKGNNALWVEVNPVNNLHTSLGIFHTNHCQLEEYHFNNLVRIPFRVSGDNINPLLDVTFDGVHILNDDIVSAKPNVLIKLKDENKFLALNDTSDFKVFLQSPGSSTAKRVWFGPQMSFIPAVLPNNSCKLNFTPALIQDGTYQLLVQASDISHNQSGAVDYKISFEVINKATITEVMNYPNPFNNATHFVFTLTGSQIPTTFKIQIMTITGKVVKEIYQDEIGFIHIGRNITDYAWDGRDMYGDKLANGVYLYRVITKLNGNDVDLNQTDADQYFKKGWGKMYMMH